MTENDILKDLEACTKGHCDDCSRDYCGDCTEKLMKDSLSVIKLQANEIKNSFAIVDDLRSRVRDAQLMGPEASVEEIVKIVNEIITDAYDAAGCGDYVGNVVASCQEFAKLLRLDNAYVAFGSHSVYPQIWMNKK